MAVGLFLLRRFGHGLVLLLLVATLSFLLLEFAPGDFLADARVNPEISPATISALRETYGLNRPLPVRYGRWVASVVRGDMGMSFSYKLPVSRLVWPRARKTLALTTAALAIAWCIALPLGIWAASSRAAWIDGLFSVTTSSLLTVPDILIASLLLFAAARMKLWHSSGAILPAATLVLLALPPLLRHVRSAILQTAGEPWVRAARGLGISGPRLWIRHVLPAAANPLISLLGLSIGTLVSSSLVVEAITGYPGLGPLFLEAISARDLYLVLGPVILSAVFLITSGILTDLLLYAADPRIRRMQ